MWTRHGRRSLELSYPWDVTIVIASGRRVNATRLWRICPNSLIEFCGESMSILVIANDYLTRTAFHHPLGDSKP
jgi:hypothetical protein